MYYEFFMLFKSKYYIYSQIIKIYDIKYNKL